MGIFGIGLMPRLVNVLHLNGNHNISAYDLQFGVWIAEKVLMDAAG
jgi:hypothetical protein